MNDSGHLVGVNTDLWGGWVGSWLPTEGGQNAGVIGWEIGQEGRSQRGASLSKERVWSEEYTAGGGAQTHRVRLSRQAGGHTGLWPGFLGNRSQGDSGAGNYRRKDHRPFPEAC